MENINNESSKKEIRADVKWLLQGIDTAWVWWSDPDPGEELTFSSIIEDLKQLSETYGKMLYDQAQSTEGPEHDRVIRGLKRFLSIIGEQKKKQVLESLGVSESEIIK